MDFLILLFVQVWLRLDFSLISALPRSEDGELYYWLGHLSFGLNSIQGSPTLTGYISMRIGKWHNMEVRVLDWSPTICIPNYGLVTICPWKSQWPCLDPVSPSVGDIFEIFSDPIFIFACISLLIDSLWEDRYPLEQWVSIQAQRCFLLKFIVMQ